MMRLARFARRTATVATGLAALAMSAGFLAAPAQASAGVSVNTFPRCTLAHCVDVTVSLEVEPAGLFDLVTFTCKVLGTPDAASTGVDDCSVGGVSAIPVPNELPGPVSTAAGTALFKPNTTVNVCGHGHSHFVENTLGQQAVFAGGCGLAVVIATPV
jgi:hypothetical protein